MIINESNGRIIDSKEVYIHDDILLELKFDRAEKTISLLIMKLGRIDEVITITFINVIGFKMTACDFWGESPHILDFEYVEHSNRTIIPKLFEMKKSTYDSNSCLTNEEDYIESVITFVSGDKLIIACERIVI